MMGPTHRIAGLLAGALYGVGAGMEWRSVVVTAVVATASSNGPLSPDCDQATGFRKATRVLPFLAHRHLTHWWGLPIIAWWVVGTQLPAASRWAAYALIVGWVSHLVGDVVFGKMPLLPWGGVWLGFGLDTGGLIETGRLKSGRRVLPFGPVKVAMVAALGWTVYESTLGLR